MGDKYVFLEPNAIVAGPATATYSNQRLPLNFMARAVGVETAASGNGAGAGGAVFVYCVGSNSDVVHGAIVAIDNGTARAINTASTGSCWQLGVAAAGLTNTNVYGWVQVAGICDYALMGGTDDIAAGASIALGSAAGRFESAYEASASAGYRIIGANNVVSISEASLQSNAATIALYYPAHIGVTANL